MWRYKRLVMMFPELTIDYIFSLIRVVKLHREHAEAVSDQIDGKVIFLQLGILAEYRTFLRVFDMFIQRQHPALLVLLG